MSIGNNIIRGKISSDTLVIPVFRFEEEGNTFYGFYRRRDKEYAVSLTDELSSFTGGICAASVTFNDRKIRMKIAEVTNIATEPVVGSQFFNLTVDNDKNLITSNASIGEFLLVPVGMSGDGYNLYAGVWYHLSLNGENVKVPVWKPDVLKPGFSGSPDFTKTSKVNYTPSVSFIPFTRDTSLWHLGQCINSTSRQFAFLRFTSWVRSRYMTGNPIYDSENCNLTTLGDISKNCIFVGNGCNLGVSYDYCMPYENCGNCLGKCENGGRCFSNSFTKKFYCEQKSVPSVVSYYPATDPVTPVDFSVIVTDPAVNNQVQVPGQAAKNLGGSAPVNSSSRSSKKAGLLWIILIISIAILALVFAFLFWRHAKKMK